MGQAYSSENGPNKTKNSLANGKENSVHYECLDDPRSPSQLIDRTPLRDSPKPAHKNVTNYKRLLNEADPRSPCVEINRTQLKGSNERDANAITTQRLLGQRLFDSESH